MTHDFKVGFMWCKVWVANKPFACPFYKKLSRMNNFDQKTKKKSFLDNMRLGTHFALD